MLTIMIQLIQLSIYLIQCITDDAWMNMDELQLIYVILSHDKKIFYVSLHGGFWNKFTCFVYASYVYHVLFMLCFSLFNVSVKFSHGDCDVKVVKKT